MKRKPYTVYTMASDFALGDIVGQFTSLKEAKRAIAGLSCEWTLGHADDSLPHGCRSLNSGTTKYEIEKIDPELYPSWYQQQKLFRQFKKTGVK